jgi:endo-beta-N-acetylglucosaminidase D
MLQFGQILKTSLFSATILILIQVSKTCVSTNPAKLKAKRKKRRKRKDGKKTKKIPEGDFWMWFDKPWKVGCLRRLIPG